MDYYVEVIYSFSEESEIVGPFDSEADAVSWGNDHATSLIAVFNWWDETSLTPADRVVNPTDWVLDTD